ncbi:MAG TPA: pectin acetylesterase-family hydrolase [Patescibacteria group bacterium]|nr:pectin acetylesterase-family hydrolase [Patescibacteria group bacterium]
MTGRIAASGMLLLGIGAWGAAQAESTGISNSCSDPYWQDTLRCAWLAHTAPMPPQPPQPVPPPPASVGAIKSYTRVDLGNPAIRCVDGTRPIIYVDRAVGPPSNRWLIAMTGGDYCSAKDLDHDLDGVFESGQECVDWYDTQNTLLMGTAYESSMSNLADQNGNGVMSADVTTNPVFARYNRVQVQKCGFDRHSGRATHENVTATLPDAGPTITYDLYSHGQLIVREALAALQGTGGSGLAFTTWTNVGGVVTPTQQMLPSIAAAEQVVFIGHSAAAHGLYQNADRYADALRAMPGFDGDVRVVHDAHFMSMVENEAAFDPAQNADPVTINTLFDQRMTGTTAAAGDYDSYRFHGHPLSPFAADYRAWLGAGETLADVLDASCVAAHPGGDAWKCADRFHVRLHHESTSALLREDFTDMGGDHNNAPWGYVLWWGELGVYSHCNGIADAGIEDMFPFSPCPPTLAVAQHRARLMVQATHFRQGVFTMAENVLNADPTDDPGSIFLWMPSCGSHTSAYNDTQFLDSSIVRNGSIKSYREFMQDFVAAPPTGVFEARVTYLDGAQSECGPLLLKDSFD